MSTPLHLLGFAGSLRKASYNRGLLRAAQALAPDDITIEIFDLLGVPLFNEDVEAEGDPSSVAALKSAVHDADGVLIVTPEYNSSLPAVTKNAVDWLSRSYNGGGQVLSQKPVGIMGATPGRLSTARAQMHLRMVLTNTNSYVMPQPGMMIAGAGKLFDEDRTLTDPGTEKRVQKFLSALADWVRLTT